MKKTIIEKDVWITVEEATDRIMSRADVVECDVKEYTDIYDLIAKRTLRGLNKSGEAVFETRIFDGSEHYLARHNMVLDWKKKDVAVLPDDDFLPASALVMSVR